MIGVDTSQVATTGDPGRESPGSLDEPILNQVQDGMMVQDNVEVQVRAGRCPPLRCPSFHPLIPASVQRSATSMQRMNSTPGYVRM